MSHSKGVANSQRDMEARLRAVPAPRPVLDRDREHALTRRQREILDELGDKFAKGFADLTMAELAARLNCSLRTLYGMAPSRDELVMTVLDRRLRAIGRTAISAIRPDMEPLEAIQVYLGAANMAVSDTTQEFARDLAAVSAGRRLSADHSDYLVAITRALLTMAVEEGTIAAIDTTAVALVIAGLGSHFSEPEVIPLLQTSPKDAADAMVEFILLGLQSKSTR